MKKVKIYIASDHAGFDAKQDIIKALKNKYNFVDLGCHSSQSVDYPLYAFKLCKAVLKDKVNGILVCGSGFGMAISACKVKGIYCTSIVDPKMASLAKEHNNCNVIALSGRWVTLSNNIKIINNFMNAKFDPKDQKNVRHLKRLKQIKDYENKHIKN